VNGSIHRCVLALGLAACLSSLAAADPGSSTSERGAPPVLSTRAFRVKLSFELSPLHLPLPSHAPPAAAGSRRVNLAVAPVLARLGFGQDAQTGSAFIGFDGSATGVLDSTAVQLGLFAAKLWATQELCGLGRCRIDTGPGDVDASWVEELTPPK
jgi:hypothetical protein